MALPVTAGQVFLQQLAILEVPDRASWFGTPLIDSINSPNFGTLFLWIEEHHVRSTSPRMFARLQKVPEGPTDPTFREWYSLVCKYCHHLMPNLPEEPPDEEEPHMYRLITAYTAYACQLLYKDRLKMPITPRPISAASPKPSDTLQRLIETLRPLSVTRPEGEAERLERDEYMSDVISYVKTLLAEPGYFKQVSRDGKEFVASLLRAHTLELQNMQADLNALLSKLQAIRN